MKCPSCKYEYKGFYDKDTYMNKIGDEKFINIYSTHKFEIDNPKEYKHGDYNYQNKIEVNLVACPKCKTVIMCD